MTKTDREIGEAIVSELEWDTRVEEAAIEVEVEGGTASLRGSVSSWAQRLAAQEAAYRVAGVREVSNRLEVKLARDARCTDAELEKSLQSLLEACVFGPNANIRASASDGQVILEGSVDCCSQRDDIERVVRNMRGVRRVLSQISVKPAIREAHQVQTSIEAALERRIERAARRINLDVYDGKVIVSGIVCSWAERQSVLSAAKGTRGVRSVDDRLSVEP